jgi:linoleoyl-CoA desaturase
MGGTIYVLAETFHNWHNTMCCITPPISQDMMIQMQVELSVLQKKQNGITSRFQQYYSVFLYGLLTFNWAITTDFKQNEKLLEEKIIIW